MTLAGQVAIVTKNPTLYGKLVQWFTRSEAYHTVGMISETHCVSAETPRVVIRPLSYFPDAILTDEPMTPEQRETIIAFWQNAVGKPYAYFDIAFLVISDWLGHYTPRWIVDRVQDRRRWFCSELCDAGWEAARIYRFMHRRAYMVTPADFYDYAEAKERV